METILRKATRHDHQQLQQFQKLLNEERSTHYDSETTRFHYKTREQEVLAIGDIEEDHWVIAERASKMLGYIRGSIGVRNGYALRKVGYIDELYILPKYRKQGVAKSLMKELEKVFKEKHCDLMFTKTDAENNKANALYPSAGMIPVTVEYWKEL